MANSQFCVLTCLDSIESWYPTCEAAIARATTLAERYPAQQIYVLESVALVSSTALVNIERFDRVYS